jgi:hypothetical protein
VVIEIHPASTPLTERSTFALAVPIGKVLPELVRATWPCVAVAGARLGRASGADAARAERRDVDVLVAYIVVFE